MSSRGLSGDAVVVFMRALCAVSQEELMPANPAEPARCAEEKFTVDFCFRVEISSMSREYGRQLCFDVVLHALSAPALVFSSLFLCCIESCGLCGGVHAAANSGRCKGAHLPVVGSPLAIHGCALPNFECQLTGKRCVCRVYTLQRIMDAAMDNLGRIRLVWGRLWAALAAHLVAAACHADPHVSVLAVGHMRALVQRLLSRSELSCFTHQAGAPCFTLAFYFKFQVLLSQHWVSYEMASCSCSTPYL